MNDTLPDLWFIQSMNAVASTLYARHGYNLSEPEDPFPNSKTFLGVKSPQLAMAFVTLGDEGWRPEQPLKVNIAQECDLCFLDCDVSVHGGSPKTRVLRAQHGTEFERNFTKDNFDYPYRCWRPPGVAEADLNWTSDPLHVNFFGDHHMAFCLEFDGSLYYDPFDWGYRVGKLLSSHETALFECFYGYDLNDTECAIIDNVNGWLTPSSDIMGQIAANFVVVGHVRGYCGKPYAVGSGLSPQ